MSVSSKALRFIVLAGLVSGCSIPRNQTGPETAAIDKSRSDEAAIESVEEPLEAASVVEPELLTEESLSVTTLASAEAVGFDLLLEERDGESRFIVIANKSIETDISTVASPPRLVVDLKGLEAAQSKDFPLDSNKYAKSLRVGQHPDKVRLVIDLTEHGASEDLSHNLIESEGEKVEIAFFDKPKADTIQTTGIIVDTLEFEKKPGSGGRVVVTLSEEAAYELKQTAPTEYSLLIPGTEASSRTKVPQISPPGFPGIRSARTIQEGENSIVRMFVDAGVAVEAKPVGSKIVLTAKEAAVGESIADMSAARAQLGEEDLTDPLGNDDELARANPTGVVSDDGGKIYTGRLISLDLQDTDIDNALRIIAEVSNLNIIASDDVTGKVTLRLIDVPWDQALDVILKTNGLDQVTEGNVIRIAPVEKLRQEREARREAIRALENLEKLAVRYIRVSYARVTDLQEQVEAVLSERGSVTVDERTNQLIIKDISRGQEEAQNLIEKLDLRTPQVLLETQIVEGQRNILRELGFQWNFNYVQSPETGNATGLNFPNDINIGGGVAQPDGTSNLVSFPAVIAANGGSAISAILSSADGSKTLFARLSALESEGKVKIVSRPQVATVNNKRAVISSVETVRVRLPDSGLSVATGSGASAQGGGQAAFEEIDVGIELTVTPQASPDYYVLLDINASSSTFGDREVDGIPSTVNRQATSTILVKSGMTFALGGVYRIEDQDIIEGVPWLKDLPFFGWAFRRTSTDKSDEELIFFITPHIVEGSFDPGAMVQRG